MIDIQLDWKGPFGLSAEHRACFSPPRASGVYIWSVAPTKGYRVSYIGECANLADRMYHHVHCMLGGAYTLYGDDHLDDGAEPKPLYEPGPQILYTRFCDEYTTLSQLALRNATAYQFFWTE